MTEPGRASGRTWRAELSTTLRLAGPIMLGNLGQVMIGVVDSIMVGRVGVVELSACSFVMNLFLIPFVVLIGLLAAVPVLAAQARGKGDAAGVASVFKHGLWMTIGASVAVGALMVLNARWLGEYGQSPEVVEASRGYYLLVVASLVPALIFQFFRNFSEGLGWSGPPMVILLSGIALNAALNWVLIFGKLGFPALGLEGAGWATLISRAGIALGLIVYVGRAVRFRGLLPERWLRLARWGEFGPLLRLGVPIAFQHLFEVGAFCGAGILIGWLGAEPLAAHQIAISCAAMAFMVPMSVSIATGIRAGEAFSRGDMGTLRRIGFGAFGFTLVQTSLFAVFFLIAGETLAGYFVTDPEVVALGASILVVVGLFQIFDGAQVICLGTLRGMSDVTVTTFIAFVSYWLVALPAGFVFGFPLGKGAVGVWMGLAFGLFVAAVALFARLALKARRG